MTVRRSQQWLRNGQERQFISKIDDQQSIGQTAGEKSEDECFGSKHRAVDAAVFLGIEWVFSTHL